MRVARMDLDGEHLVRIEELEQQGKSAKASRQLSHQLLRKLIHQLADGAPFKRPIGHRLGMVFAVAQHPRLADWAVTGQRRPEQLGQPPAAPQPILIDWIESQRYRTV